MVSQKVDAMNWLGFEPTTTRYVLMQAVTKSY